MIKHFAELLLPSLVTDVQAIFWNDIFPNGQNNRNQTLKNVRIDPVNPAHRNMSNIVNKYPFLVNHLLIFTLPENFATPIHMDGLGTDKTPRKISCNIPIEGCGDTCVTEFFEARDVDFIHDIAGTTRFLRNSSTAIKVNEYVLKDMPILTNTQFPHRVNNRAGTTKRISVSWTVDHSLWSLDEIVKFSENLNE